MRALWFWRFCRVVWASFWLGGEMGSRGGCVFVYTGFIVYIWWRGCYHELSLFTGAV